MWGLRPRVLGPGIFSATGHFYQGPAHAGAAPPPAGAQNLQLYWAFSTKACSRGGCAPACWCPESTALLRGLRPRLLGPRIYSPAGHFLPGPAHAGAAPPPAGAQNLQPYLAFSTRACSSGAAPPLAEVQNLQPYWAFSTKACSCGGCAPACWGPESTALLGIFYHALLTRGLRPRLLGPRIYSPAGHFPPAPAHVGAAPPPAGAQNLQLY